MFKKTITIILGVIAEIAFAGALILIGFIISLLLVGEVK